MASNSVLVPNCSDVQVSTPMSSRCYVYFLVSAFYIITPTFTVPLALLLVIYSNDHSSHLGVFFL